MTGITFISIYENSAANLKAYSKLAGLHLDQITAEHIAGFVAHRQGAKVQVSTVNRDLATFRRKIRFWAKPAFHGSCQKRRKARRADLGAENSENLALRTDLSKGEAAFRWRRTSDPAIAP